MPSAFRKVGRRSSSLLIDLSKGLSVINMGKWLSSGFFGLTISCFCLPWVTVSCSQQKLMTVSGIQMVSGVEFDEPGSGMFGGPVKRQRIKPNIMAIVALVTVIVALLISLIGGSASVVPALIGIATAIALKVNIDQDILKQGQGLLLVNYESGFIEVYFPNGGRRHIVLFS